MKEKSSRRHDGKAVSQFRFSYEAITVGSGRDAEPYILAFHYKSDNVAGKNLGTLFGFFEVEIHDEDAAYIVNFLTSVAKKEYFANPRRPIEDGFETMLHKVNVALAEVAKEGNVSWLGHLHGILGAVSGSHLSFSATGEGVLGLVREDMFRSISDGLAENPIEPHPLKTFTEVSSGQLMDGDVLLVLSPATWTLFTPEDLKKNIRRFSGQEFDRFLRTALINELPIAGAVIVRVSAEPLPLSAPAVAPHANSASPEPPLTNVWSKQAFEKAKAARLTALEIKANLASETALTAAPPQSEREDDEYVDRKTGHIYIQGSTTSEEVGGKNSWQNRLVLLSGTIARNWTTCAKRINRNMRRWKKRQAIFLGNSAAFSARISRSLSRRFRSFLRRCREARQQHKRPAAALPIVPSTQPLSQSQTPAPFPTAALAHFTHTLSQQLSLFKSGLLKKTSAPPRQSRHWLQLLSATLTAIKSAGIRLVRTLLLAFKSGFTLFQVFWSRQTAQQRARWLGGLGILSVAGLGSIFYFQRSPLWTSQDAQVTNSLTSTATQDHAYQKEALEQSEPLAIRLADGRLLGATPNTELIALTSINHIPLGITRDHIIDIASQTSIPTPEPIRLAAAMDDLDAIFLLGESGVLSMYTPNNKKFTQNILPLPAGVKPSALGSYLTYLYVLDATTHTIYRFPRIENGFGQPLTWSKETITSDTRPSFVIGTSIALIGTDHLPHLYERGKQTATTFQGTHGSIDAAQLVFDPVTSDLLALDPNAQRIVRWKTDGTLVAQYFHPAFRTATQLLIGENNALLIAGPEGIVTFQLPL